MGLVTTLREIVADYADHRDLLWQLVLRDLRVRYKQAVMGFLWALFMPLLLVAAGVLIRLAISGAGHAPLDAASMGAVALGGLLWATFASAVSFGTASLVNNAALVGRIHFPREVLPMAAVLSHVVDGAVGGVVLVAFLPWLGARWSPALLWVPVLLLLLVALACAAALALSAANLFFRDVKYLVQALLSVGVLFTPVFFAPASVGRSLQWVLWLNPLSPLLEGMRLAVFEGHDLAARFIVNGVVRWSPEALTYAAVLAIGGLLVASVLFHRAEDAFAEHV